MPTQLAQHFARSSMTMRRRAALPFRQTWPTLPGAQAAGPANRSSGTCSIRRPTIASALCARPPTATMRGRSMRRTHGWPPTAMPTSPGRHCCAGGKWSTRFWPPWSTASPKSGCESSCVVGDDAPVTLRFLIEDYLTHQRWHFAQLKTGCRSLAERATSRRKKARR